MRDRQRLPFSYTLFLIAILHFSVWSIGVCESHSRGFFVREQQNQKSINLSDFQPHCRFIHQHLAVDPEELIRSQVLEYQNKVLCEQKNSKLDPIARTVAPAESTFFFFPIFTGEETSSEAPANPSALYLSVVVATLIHSLL